MSLRAPSGLLVLACVACGALAAGGVARADRPTSPPRLVDGCKRDPQSSLCREVRRLCATKAVRDDVVAACQSLGWWGDTTYREITNLCPIDPTHADCQSTKALCESQRAAQIGEDGEKICREMGWGAYAYANLGAPGEGDSAGDGEGEAGEEGDGGSAALSPALPEAGAASAARVPLRAAWAAGMAGAGLRLGLVDDGAQLGGHDALFGGHLQATLYSFTRLPLAAGFVGDLGLAGATSHIVYQADALVGPGRWWTPHLALGLLGGVGVSGIGGGDQAFAVDVPLRLAGIAHAGDRVTLEGWAQLTWLVATSAARGAGSSSVGFADAAELGGAFVWGARPAAGVVPGTGFWLGGLYQEQSGTRIVSIMIGLGAARNPWVP